MDRLELTFLGTASAYPTPNRGVSCIALNHDQGVWMFDCGEGSQIQLMKSHLKPGKINKIFITHLHGDHLFGLPGLLCTISQSNQGQEGTVLEIYGPIGLRHYLCTSLYHSRSELNFSICIIELNTLPCQIPSNTQHWPVVDLSEIPFIPGEKTGQVVNADDNDIWHLYSDDKLTVQAVWLKHRVPSFAFIVYEAEKVGKLNVAKLKELGVPPGPLYSKLKAGQVLELDNGTKIRPEDVLAEPVPGRSIVIGGDSCDSSQLTKVANKATVLVHEATLENALKETCVQNGHSTPEMIATLAKELDVRTLILTHFSQRYKPLDADVKEGEASVKVLKQEAGEVFPEDRIHLAQDLWAYQIHR